MTGPTATVARPHQKDRTDTILSRTDRLEKAITRALRNSKNAHRVTQERAMALSYLTARLEGLRFDEVSVLIGTSSKRLAAFLHGTESVPKSMEDRIRLLDELLRNLHRVLEPRATGQWFRTRIPALGDVTPIEALRNKSRLQEITAVTESYLDTDYT